MNEINYQALREAAEKATCGKRSFEYGESRFDGDYALVHREVVGHIPICRIERAHPESGFDEDFQMEQQTNVEFITAANLATVLVLLGEWERNQQHIKHRDQENEDIALTAGKLKVEPEGTKSELNEQREYYEGIILDGGEYIAELEKNEEQLTNERDHAESALADMYLAATGDEPEWSNWFGFSDATDAAVGRIVNLEVKQPSPVVPEGLVKAVRFYEQVKCENPPVETEAWKNIIDWALKEPCQAVNTDTNGDWYEHSCRQRTD